MLELIKQNEFKGTLDDFEFPPKSPNNKKILLMMAHSDICPYSEFKSSYRRNPKQNIISRTELGDKHFYNVQVLSTQTIGRPGYQSIYSLFYELLDNEIWVDALLEIESQADAENLNKLFKYLYTFYKRYKYDITLTHMYGKQYKGKKELTNFRIYPKKTKPKYPMNQGLSFYPSYDDEVRGIFDLTTIKKKGKHSRYSLIMTHKYDIKQCFKNQIDRVVKQMKKKPVGVELQKLRLKRIQAALLIPDDDTIEKLDFSFTETGRFASSFYPIKPTIELFFKELKYNLAIFNIYRDFHLSNPEGSLSDFDINLSTILKLIREVSATQDDILLIENSCKLFYGSEFGSDNKIGDIVASQKKDRFFDYQSALIAKREQSRNISDNLENVEEPEPIKATRDRYIKLLKETEKSFKPDPNFYSKLANNPYYKKRLEDFNFSDFEKLLEDIVGALEDLQRRFEGKKIKISRDAYPVTDAINNYNLQIYLIKQILDTY